MNSVVFVNIAIILSVGLLGLYFSRGAAVLLLLLPASQVFGLVRQADIVERGIVDVHLILALAIAGLIVASFGRVPELAKARFLIPALIWIGFWAYGVVYPLRHGGSTLFYAVKASKEFLTVFSYFAVALFLRTERDVQWGWRFLLGLGLYYSVIEMAAQVLGEGFLRRLTFDYQPEGVRFWKVFVLFWPVILIAFFHAFFELVLRVNRSYLSLLASGFGLLLTFFRSYLLGAAGAILVVLVMARRNVNSIASGALFFGFVLGTAVVLMALVGGGKVTSPGGALDHFVLSGIRELQTQKGGSIEGREVFAQARREILQRNPYTGYGFVDKESKLGRRFQEHMVGDMLGFIDKGDVDTALKFGIPGRALLYAVYAYLAWTLIQLARQRLRPMLDVRCLAVAATVIVYLVVQPFHAPLTYSFGLLPLGIALGLIERERALALGQRHAEAAEPVGQAGDPTGNRILSWSGCSILSRP